MPTLTLHQQNQAVLTIEQKIGKAIVIVKKALAKVDPDGYLVFAQAHEIERLEARNLALGFILSHVEEAQKSALREFNRLQANGVDVDTTVVEAVRTCLAERKENDN